MTRKRLAGAVLAAALAFTGTGAATIATAAPAEAATCCLKPAEGTWGGYIKTDHVFLRYVDRYTQQWRASDVYWRWTDGKWQPRVKWVHFYVVRLV